MHRYFRDAVADDRVHGFSRGAERRFVNPREIQLRFGRGQWIHGRLALHERKQSRHGRGLPLQQQPRGGSLSCVADLFLNVSHRNIDVGLHAYTAKIDVQFSRDQLRPGSSRLRSRLEYSE